MTDEPIISRNDGLSRQFKKGNGKVTWIIAGIKYGSAESSRNKKYQLRNVESKTGIFCVNKFWQFH